MSCRLLAGFAPLALLLALATPATAQEAVANGGLFTGSGSLSDVIRGTHSRAPLTQGGSVGDRVQTYRGALSQSGALRSPARPLSRSIWQAVKWGAIRAAPAAGVAALADSPVVPIGDAIGLGMIAVSIVDAVWHRNDVDDQSQTRTGAQTRARDEEDRQSHRGRIQAQGGGLEASVPWAQSTPPTKAQGLAMVAELKAQIGARETRRRTQSFRRAERFIQGAGLGVITGFKQGWTERQYNQNERDPSVRVDIEIQAGRAFVD